MFCSPICGIVPSFSFSNNTEGITSFSLEGVYVSNLDLSGCTSLASSVQGKWNSWKVASLTMQRAGLTGVRINNTYIKYLDISNNSGMGSLVANTDSSIKDQNKYKNLSTIKASGCDLVSVDVYMNVDDSAPGAGLYLNNNKLGITSGTWTSKKETSVRIAGKPESTEKPSRPGVGSEYIEYANITGPVVENCTTCNGTGLSSETKPVYETCTDCSGTGKVDCSTCNGNRYVKDNYDCPACKAKGLEPISYSSDEKCSHCDGKGCSSCFQTGKKVLGACRQCVGKGTLYGDVSCKTCDATGKVTCSECNGTGEIKAVEYNGCNVCEDSSGIISWYTADRTTYTFTGSNMLKINGKSITLSYASSLSRESNLSYNFANEWKELEKLTVALYGNEICYSGGFAKSKTDATWDISFTVRTAGTPGDKVVALYKTKASDDGNKNFDFDGYIKANSTILKRIGKEGDENREFTYTLGDISSASTNQTVTFVNHRYKYVFGFKIKAARGPEMFIYPFGK